MAKKKFTVGLGYSEKYPTLGVSYRVEFGTDASHFGVMYNVLPSLEEAKDNAEAGLKHFGKGWTAVIKKVEVLEIVKIA